MIKDLEVRESKEFLDEKKSFLVLVPSPQVTIKRDLERIADAFLEFQDTFPEVSSAADILSLRTALCEFLLEMQDPEDIDCVIKASERLELVLIELGVQ